MITDQNMDQWLKEMAKGKPTSRLPDEPLTIISMKNAETIQDKSMVMTNIRKNIEQYGIRDGLKVSNAAIIPQRLLSQTTNNYN